MRTSLVYFGWLFFFLVASCSSTNITCVNAKSPGGTWIANGCTYDTVGPGANDLSTSISLKSTTNSGLEKTLLVFENESSISTEPIKFAMVWVTPQHLEVQFNWMPKFVSQVSRYADIEISVRDMSSGTKSM